MSLLWKRFKTSWYCRTINLGKDEGTALLAQTLYQAIDDGSEEKKTTKKLGFGKKQEATKKTKAKQFLAFQIVDNKLVSLKYSSKAIMKDSYLNVLFGKL